LKKLILFLFVKIFAITIYIGSAANLTYVMPEIIKKFNKQKKNKFFQILLLKNLQNFNKSYINLIKSALKVL